MAIKLLCLFGHYQLATTANDQKLPAQKPAAVFAPDQPRTLPIIIEQATRTPSRLTKQFFQFVPTEAGESLHCTFVLDQR